jgi:uroporphyrinogen decarboxylase
MTTLTSRERVRLALNHEEPDRVPVDFGASRVTGIGAIAYAKLLRYLGREETIRVYDIKQQLALPSLEMIDCLGGDVVQVHRLGPTTALPFLEIDRWKPGTLTDGSPCLVPEAFEETREDGAEIAIKYQGQRAARRSPESLYFDVCWAPLANAQSPAEIDAFRWPDPWTPREEDFVRRQIQELHHGTDKALFAGLPLLVGSFFEISLVLFGFENFMMMLAGDRDLVEHWLDFKLAHDLEILGKFLAVTGPYLAAIQMCDDFGAQDSLQISPRIYREVFKPRQRKWIEFVKTRTNAKVFLHSDGAIAQILPDLIEIGVDILNPLQTSAAGMDARHIKAEYGRDLSFWGGGVDTQTTLPFGSVDDIKREARERLEILAPGGGFVFAPIHNIQPDISPEKVLAIYETAEVRGRYPKR